MGDEDIGNQLCQSVEALKHLSDSLPVVGVDDKQLELNLSWCIANGFVSEEVMESANAKDTEGYFRGLEARKRDETPKRWDANCVSQCMTLDWNERGDCFKECRRYQREKCLEQCKAKATYCCEDYFCLLGMYQRDKCLEQCKAANCCEDYFCL